MMESLQILKFQAKQGLELNFTEGLGEKDEQAELEAEEMARPDEDIQAYLKSIYEREDEE